MKKYPTLSNAPIAEAVIDFRINPPDNFDISSIKDATDTIKNDYPLNKTQKRSGVKFGVDKDEQVFEPEPIEIMGYQFWSSDKKQVVLFAREGFTFSRLSPYSNWEQFSVEAKKLWELYNSNIKPLSITRLAVRYINKIECVTEHINLDDILTAPPLVPKDLSIEMEGFLSRLVFHKNGSDLKAIVTQTLSKDITDQFPSVILDIDAFCERPDGIEIQNICKIIDELRQFKNEIFFKSITSKQMGVFK